MTEYAYAYAYAYAYGSADLPIVYLFSEDPAETEMHVHVNVLSTVFWCLVIFCFWTGLKMTRPRLTFMLKHCSQHCSHLEPPKPIFRFLRRDKCMPLVAWAPPPMFCCIVITKACASDMSTLLVYLVWSVCCCCHQGFVRFLEMSCRAQLTIDHVPC